MERRNINNNAGVAGGMTGYGPADTAEAELLQRSAAQFMQQQHHHHHHHQQQQHLSPATSAILEGLEEDDDDSDGNNPNNDDLGDGGDGTSTGGRGPNGEKRSGRRKIKIEYIDDKSRRHITFSKRKAGIMKKVLQGCSVLF